MRSYCAFALVPILALAGAMTTACNVAADITGATATGEIFFSTSGFGTEGTTGIVPIPQNPGFLTFSVPGTRGSLGFLNETWDYATQPWVYIPGATPFLNQNADAPAAAGAGEAALQGNFAVNYTLDASGLGAYVAHQSFTVGGLLGGPGGPGGTASFEFDIIYTHSVLGTFGALDGFIGFSGSGPFSGVVSDSLALPAMGAGTLTLSGFFRLRVDDNPGDGIVSEIGVRTVPEPTTLLLFGLAGAGAGAVGWWRRRTRALMLAADEAT